MKHLRVQDDLTLFQAMVEGLIFKNDKVVGVKTSFGIEFYGQTVVVTTGTFLRGLMHIGQKKSEGGRLVTIQPRAICKLSGSWHQTGAPENRYTAETTW